MAQLVIPGAGVENGSGIATAGEPDPAKVSPYFETNTLNNLGFNVTAEDDTPGDTTLGSVLRAGGACAGVGAVDCAFFH